jgi:GDP-L-fucose synthase
LRLDAKRCRISVINRTILAGHAGIVGSALVRQLLNAVRSHESITCRSRDEVDLIDQSEVRALFKAERFDEVYLAAAWVGGIHATFTVGVRKRLFLGSRCIYPRLAAQPMREDAPLSRRLEPTNDGSSSCTSKDPPGSAASLDRSLCNGLHRRLQGLVRVS